MAKALALGLGWILSNEGLPLAAEPLIAAARVMLAATKADIMKRYVDVVYAASERARSGCDPVSLRRVLATLRASYSAFAKHSAYRMKTASELAMALTLAGDSDELDEAEQYVHQIQSVAGDNDRWQCNAYVLESRIHRKRAEMATSEAQKTRFIKAAVTATENALNKAESLQGDAGVFNQIDAHIANGEALLLSGRLFEAKSAFERGLRGSAGNVKVVCACHLHLAEVCVALRQKANAHRHIECWKSMKARVTNAWLARMGERVENSVTEMKDFLVPFTHASLDDEELRMMLRIHLRDTALERAKTNEAAAALCRVSPATFRSWRHLENDLDVYRKQKAAGTGRGEVK